MNAAVETRAFGVSSPEIGAIDTWVERVGLEWGESERTVFRARLCIAELAANVLEHGVSKSGVARIVVALRRLGDGIGIEFRDSCEPFDPTRRIVVAGTASIESASEGGRGLMLLQAYAKELSYCNDESGNRVTLKINSN
ncbi:MAG TPA: ATP-binding protein [Xanthobacteraceae bacterium]